MAGHFSYFDLLASVEESHQLPTVRSEHYYDNWKSEVGITNLEYSVEIQQDEDFFCNSGQCDVDEEDGDHCLTGGSEDELSECFESDSVNSEEETDVGVEQSCVFDFDDTSSDEDNEEQKEDLPACPESCEGSNGLDGNGIPSTNIDINSVHTDAGYKKRKRYTRGQKLPSCRESRNMSAAEVAFRGSSSRKTEQIFLPVLGTVFDSAAEAYEFYNLYSWEKGFGINYGKSDTNRVNGYRTMQELQCACEGRDNRRHQTQRCGCKALIRLLRTEDHGWYISKFVEDHNHKLSESCGEKMNWGSHRRIDASAKNMIKYLRDNNVPLGKVHSIMGSFYGTVRDLPFTKRSLRTLCQQLAREQLDNDVKKTLEIFRKMRQEDPDFAYSVDVDKHNRIKTLIWTNHRSKMQYECFGDALTFDTTYCTNIYKMPFGLFVGVNNHFQSVIYAGVLMRKEKTKSFIWVFNEFLSLMGGNAPQTILTDQCQAMMSALKVSMPDTTHLWCKWHVLKKAQESLGPVYSRKGTFRPEFHKVLNEMLTEEEFENAWEHLITKYKLRKNPFMIRTYECRVMWAKPYSKDKFCARMMSTQRSESANNMLKTYVRGNSTMNNFVEKYNDMIFDRAMEEDREEHKTKLLKKSTKKMWPLQNHACKIYTRATFKLFTAELEKSYHYVVDQSNDLITHYANHCYPELREPWVRISFKVTANKESGIYDCECGLFTHFGILCCHAIRVMNYLGVVKIPNRYILKRWTKDARDVLPENMRFLQKDSRSLKSHTFRDSLLYGTAMKAVQEGNLDVETFTEMMKHLGNGIKAVRDLVAARGDPVPVEAQPHYESSDNEWHRGERAGYQSEPDLGAKGKKIIHMQDQAQLEAILTLLTLKAPLLSKNLVGGSVLKDSFLQLKKQQRIKRNIRSLEATVVPLSNKQVFAVFAGLVGTNGTTAQRTKTP